MSIQTPPLIENGPWRIDSSRSRVEFRVRHFGVATVRGRFESFSGRVEAGEGGLRVDGRVDVASVETGHGIRDSRLRTEFFDAERHPAIVLHADSSGELPRLRGELTIRGVTRPVELAVSVDARGDVARMRAVTTIRRSDFGLEWDALRDAGRVLVADEVRLRADVVLTPA
jgi:polyisoprenoid-binding protein YceI